MLEHDAAGTAALLTRCCLLGGTYRVQSSAGSGSSRQWHTFPRLSPKPIVCGAYTSWGVGGGMYMTGGAGCVPMDVVGGVRASIIGDSGLASLPTLEAAPALGGGRPLPATAPPDEAGGGQMQLSCAQNQDLHWITLIRSPHSGGIKVMAMDAHMCMGTGCAQGRSSSVNDSCALIDI